MQTHTTNHRLGSNLINKIVKFKKQHEFVYATSAHSLTYDQNGNEIYGIINIINYFKNNKEIGLVIADPSFKYKEFVEDNNLLLTSNILIINESLSFFMLLKQVDANIRNTSTDGDSISLRESLFLNKLTLATDVVSRPKGTMIYKRGEYNFIKHDNFSRKFGALQKEIEPVSITSLIEVYSNG